MNYLKKIGVLMFICFSLTLLQGVGVKMHNLQEPADSTKTSVAVIDSLRAHSLYKNISVGWGDVNFTKGSDESYDSGFMFRIAYREQFSSACFEMSLWGVHANSEEDLSYTQAGISFAIGADKFIINHNIFKLETYALGGVSLNLTDNEEISDDPCDCETEDESRTEIGLTGKIGAQVNISRIGIFWEYTGYLTESFASGGLFFGMVIKY